MASRALWPSVLLVDDDAGVVETLSDILRTKGYHVVAARSGEEAVALAKGIAYDAILMDIRMPGLNGVQTLRAIRAGAPKAQAIMMTAFSDKELEEEAVRTGVLAVLHKPLEMNRVLALLERAAQAGGGQHERLR